VTKTKEILYASTVAFALMGLLPARPASAQAASSAPAVNVGTDAIGGVVTSTKGPEAGVWVIAETHDLPTKYVKIVVTDDQGRYLLPGLPAANYQVWVRGYGLVDSQHIAAKPGTSVNLTAVIAPDAHAAAQYYPAIYWYSMLKIPDASLFTGETRDQNMPDTMTSQLQWLNIVKTNGCITCHQIGNLATRTIPKALGHFDKSADAWERRIESGQSSAGLAGMTFEISNLDTQLAFNNFGDWTDRIANGALPPTAPPRPTGVERNIVITEWDWAGPKMYLHDAMATDKRNPTVNAYGPIYGSPELSTDDMPVLDPLKAVASRIHEPVLDPKTPSSKDEYPQLAPSPYWGDELIWDSQAIVHSPMLDADGRVWYSARLRPEPNPVFCKAGSDNPSAKLFPLATSHRQFSIFDPKTQKFTLVDTCFSPLHMQFGFDANNTLWTGYGGTPVLGWVDTKKFLETGDAAHSQGWTPFIVDTIGNGKRDAATPYTEPGKPIEPGKDARISVGPYGVVPDPKSNRIIWGSIQQTFGPGAVIRVDLGDNPPATALTEYYVVPSPGYGLRGLDIDSKGVVWVALASGQFASFDRQKCKGPLNGPNAVAGKLCTEGWTLYPFPGPNFAGVQGPGSAEASYYTWVDQHNVSTLGADTPIATGNESDALLALVNDKFVTIRVPYPLNFYVKNVDGRIDDPNAGWKGRGLWTANGNRTPQHMEGGPGTTPKVYHIQFRPDPLAD
jgi:hypothetical protein